MNEIGSQKHCLIPLNFSVLSEKDEVFATHEDAESDIGMHASQQMTMWS